MRWLILILAALAAAAPAAAQLQMTARETAAVQVATGRGALIHAYDQAAWHGTDDLRKKLPDFAAKVGGWIVDGPAEAPQLVFFDRDPADPKAFYLASFRGAQLVRGRILSDRDDRSLSPRRKAMIAALQAARKALRNDRVSACKPNPFNTVVLPPGRAGGPTLVYFLTPQTDTNAIPFGGHYMIEVSADGKASKARRFANTCLELPLEDKGGSAAALVVTHLLDPVPTEIHVFASLTAQRPVYVATGMSNRIWGVEGNRIRLLSKDLDRQGATPRSQ